MLDCRPEPILADQDYPGCDRTLVDIPLFSYYNKINGKRTVFLAGGNEAGLLADTGPL